MRLVAMPTDADPDVVFGTKNLLDSGFKAAVDLRDSLCQPVGNRFGPPQLTRGVVVAETERGDSPIAFELAKLKGLERKGADRRDELLFDGRGNEVGSVAQPFGFRAQPLKQSQLFRHTASIVERNICKFAGCSLKGLLLRPKW